MKTREDKGRQENDQSFTLFFQKCTFGTSINEINAFTF